MSPVPLRPHSIPITGLVTASSLGMSLGELTEQLRAEKRGLSTDHRYLSLTRAPCGQLDHSHFEPYGPLLGPWDGACMRLTYASLAQLAEQTALFDRYKPEEIGLFLGTSTAGVDDLYVTYQGLTAEERAALELKEFVRTHHVAGQCARVLKRLFPIRGMDATFATACSSAAHAMAEGFWALQNGLVKACVVGGFDTLNSIALSGFEALQVVDSTLCKPFARERRGINLGEGGALFLLERPEHLRTQQSQTAAHTPQPYHTYRVPSSSTSSSSAQPPSVYGYLSGVGSSSDAYHITHPEPSGAGMALAMRRALECAHMPPEKVGYINAHGTGTPANDLSEATAIHAVFGKRPEVSSTKGYHGHLLGSAAALEAAVSLAALVEQRSWRGVEADACEFGELITPARGAPLPNLDAVLSNSFGFGGNNVSLLFTRRAWS